MSPQQKSQVRVGIITTLVGGLLLLAFTKLSGQVVLRPEVEALHTQMQQDRLNVEHQIERSEARLESKIEDTRAIALDLLCTNNPNHRRCK